MTDRAKRAAEELIRRGWQIDREDESQLDKECAQCGQQIPGDARFCQHCGTRVADVVGHSAITDLEAAISEAMKAPA